MASLYLGASRQRDPARRICGNLGKPRTAYAGGLVPGMDDSARPVFYPAHAKRVAGICCCRALAGACRILVFPSGAKSENQIADSIVKIALVCYNKD